MLPWRDRSTRRAPQLALASRSGDDLGLEGALGIECDVTDPASVQAAVGAALERFGRLDVVVANAGVGSYGPFLEMDARGHRGDDRHQPQGRDLHGPLHARRTWSRRKGDFVSLASVAGLRAFPGEAVYNASKFGQVGFTRALDHEMREQGVRVTNIAPGGIATDFAMGSGRTPDMPELEGMMSAEEVADVVLFAVTRPRGMRMLTVSFRPMSEGSWG